MVRACSSQQTLFSARIWFLEFDSFFVHPVPRQLRRETNISKSTTQAEKKIKTIRYLEANYLVFDHVWAKGELKWCLCDMLAKSSAPRDFPLLLLFNHSLHAIVEATSSLLDRSGTLCLAAMTWTGIKAKKTARVSTCRTWKLPSLVSRRHRQHVHLLGNAG